MFEALDADKSIMGFCTLNRLLATMTPPGRVAWLLAILLLGVQLVSCPVNLDAPFLSLPSEHDSDPIDGEAHLAAIPARRSSTHIALPIAFHQPTGSAGRLLSLVEPGKLTLPSTTFDRSPLLIPLRC
jgi:hypothetical protein